MPGQVPTRNRGPAAGPANHAALLAAARRLFATQGYRVPLNAIAREAKVSQGVLYRHFPTRLDLALAVFEENFVALEAIATGPHDEHTFLRIWRRLIEFTIESTAFIDLVLDDQPDLPPDIGPERLVHLLEDPLRLAQAAGLANPSWTVDDMVLVLHMLHGVVSAQIDRAHIPAAVDRALRLVDEHLI